MTAHTVDGEFILSGISMSLNYQRVAHSRKIVRRIVKSSFPGKTGRDHPASHLDMDKREALQVRIRVEQYAAPPGLYVGYDQLRRLIKALFYADPNFTSPSCESTLFVRTVAR